MGTWIVDLPRNVEAQLRELPEKLLPAALAFVESLAEDPFPPDALKLAGYNDLYRIHLDGWRILYRVNRRQRRVRIERIRPRGVAYLGLEPL